MPTITIIGTGRMARGIATRALAGGYDVQLIAHDDEKDALVLAEQLGEEPNASRITTGMVGDLLTGDMVVLAVPYEAAAELIREYGDALAGTVVVDITNPLNPSSTGLLTPAGTSAGEELAAELPAGASLVKAFNTVFASTLPTGEVAGEPLDVFVASDDEPAKAQVSQFIKSAGMRAVDVGPLTRSQQLEGLTLLHIAMQQTLGTQFNTALKVLE